MPLQRARAAESRVRNRLSNGPLRAQGKGLTRVFCDVRHTSVAGDMKVSRKCTGQTVNQGGTADSVVLFVICT